MTDFAFLTLKAFGDYAIAYANLNGLLEPSSHFIGSHLAELANAIDGDWQPSILTHGDRSVPAAYDVRKRGVVAAGFSMVQLRDSISRVDGAKILVFDRLTFRERCLAGKRAAVCLPPAPNINIAYEAFCETHDLGRALPGAPQFAASAGRGNVARIFAGSRIANKKIPVALCEALSLRLAKQGLKVETIVIEGEYPEIECSTVPLKVLPRGFRGLMDHVASADLVISADSLPAHLAAIAGRKVVVASPVANPYWLPKTCFESGAWSLFSDGVDGVLRAIDRAV